MGFALNDYGNFSGTSLEGILSMIKKTLEAKEYEMWESGITDNGSYYTFDDGVAFFKNKLSTVANNSLVRCHITLYPKSHCAYFILIKMPFLQNDGDNKTSEMAFGLRASHRDSRFEDYLAAMCNMKTYEEIRDWISLTYGW